MTTRPWYTPSGLLSWLWQIIKAVTIASFFGYSSVLELQHHWIWAAGVGITGFILLDAWYLPRRNSTGKKSRLILRILKWAAHATADPQIVAASAFAYGAIDLLGVQGTVKLILKLRRHHASTKRRPAKSNSQML